jgi:hypothetical protein
MLHIEDILSTYDTISLQEMDAVKLMNRVDTKYMFHIDQLPGILNDLQPDFRVLEINKIRLNRYETLYFDTDGHKLYLDHHNGRMNRFKIRKRRYLESGMSFFEIKCKNNKGRTQKERIRQKESPESISGKSAALLKQVTSLSPEMIKPSLWILFSRITLVNKLLTLRLTIDVGLHYRLGQKQKSYPDLVIAELKQDFTAKSPFNEIMHKYHILDSSISKYCLGIISLNDDIKHNNFKSKLLRLKKLTHVNN